jgi:hypothetical protein
MSDAYEMSTALCEEHVLSTYVWNNDFVTVNQFLTEIVYTVVVVLSSTRVWVTHRRNFDQCYYVSRCSRSYLEEQTRAQARKSRWAH